jgi:hypothetical protein
MTAGERAHYAHCPVEGCGKRLRVVPAPAKPVPQHSAPRFPGHRHPAGGNCKGTHMLVLVRHREHRCVRCRLLPSMPDGADTYDTRYRPPAPRPIDKRSPAGNPHCTSHWREVQAERKAGRAASYRRSTHGISDALFALVLALQGGGCACGKPFAKGYTPRVDHDHDYAREHCDHDPDVACPACFRGLLHDACNQVLVGRFTAGQLAAVAQYVTSSTTAALLTSFPPDGPGPEDPVFAAGWRELVEARRATGGVGDLAG